MFTRKFKYFARTILYVTSGSQYTFTRKVTTFFSLSQFCNAQTINTIIVFLYELLHARSNCIHAKLKILREKVSQMNLSARNYNIKLS